MVSETQHTVWRKNIQSNFGAAVKAISEGDKDKAQLIASMNDAMSRVLLGERIAQLAMSLNDNSEIISEMHDRDIRGRHVVERLIRTIRKDDPDKETEIAMAEDWAEGTFHGIFGLEGAELIPEEAPKSEPDDEKS